GGGLLYGWGVGEARPGRRDDAPWARRGGGGPRPVARPDRRGAVVLDPRGARPVRPGTGDGSIERDLRLILRIQAVRAFLYGVGAGIPGAARAASGASDLRVGLVGAAILAGMALSAIVVGVAGDRVGRRRAYAALLILLGVVGLGYALTDRIWILIVLALFGTMSTDANENG